MSSSIGSIESFFEELLLPLVYFRGAPPLFLPLLFGLLGDFPLLGGDFCLSFPDELIAEQAY